MAGSRGSRACGCTVGCGGDEGEIAETCVRRSGMPFRWSHTGYGSAHYGRQRVDLAPLVRVKQVRDFVSPHVMHDLAPATQPCTIITKRRDALPRGGSRGAAGGRLQPSVAPRRGGRRRGGRDAACGRAGGGLGGGQGWVRRLDERPDGLFADRALRHARRNGLVRCRAQARGTGAQVALLHGNVAPRDFCTDRIPHGQITHGLSSCESPRVHKYPRVPEYPTVSDSS
jgi:hypothetical protein